jgi:hypothetical protein
MIIQTGFLSLSIIFIGLFRVEIVSALDKTSFSSDKKKSVRKRIWIGLIAWLVIVGALSLTGFLQNFEAFPPRMMLVLFPPLAMIIYLLLSPTLKEILRHIPPRNLIRLQVFRVFVEILLWMLFVEKLLPEQMTFEGLNFDVVAGATAPFAAYLFARNRTALIIWNFIGLALLLNIVTIAVLSLPSPFQYFMNEPANTIVAHFPIVLLPAFLVPLAYTLHFFSLKQLFNKE